MRCGTSRRSRRKMTTSLTLQPDRTAMKINSLRIVLLLISVAASLPAIAQTQLPTSRPATAPLVDQHGPTIKDTYARHFLIGMAGDVPGNYSDAEVGLIRENFGAVTPENSMKPALIHPAAD